MILLVNTLDGIFDFCLICCCSRRLVILAHILLGCGIPNSVLTRWLKWQALSLSQTVEWESHDVRRVVVAIYVPDNILNKLWIVTTLGESETCVTTPHLQGCHVQHRCLQLDPCGVKFKYLNGLHLFLGVYFEDIRARHSFIIFLSSILNSGTISINSMCLITERDKQKPKQNQKNCFLIIDW